MYFTDRNGTFAVLKQKEKGAVAVLQPPLLLGKDNAETNKISVQENIEELGAGLFHISRRFFNEGNSALCLQIVLEVETLFVPEDYLIPCVSYNGNRWGEGKEPKGLCDLKGRPWSFAYDRCSIPSASVTENGDYCVALFADVSGRESLRSSVSILEGREGRLHQRISYPVIEKPATYSDNDSYSPSYEEWITLKEKEALSLDCYLLLSRPEKRHYGVCALLDRLLELPGFCGNEDRTDQKETLSAEELWRVGIQFAETLMCRAADGALLSSTGLRLDKKAGIFRHSPKIEIGWCGQNLLSARMQLLEYKRSKEKHFLEHALGILDAWTKKQADNGLILSHYNWYTTGKEWNYVPRDKNLSWAGNVDYERGWLPETCNMGWAASEMIKNYELLLSLGIDRPEYKNFAVKICDFFTERFSEAYGFGKSWHFDGTVDEKDGSIGMFVTLGLVDVYKAVKEERYLKAAEKALEFYVHRDLEQFVCTAGAIDCICVDKETAGPFLMTALELYELTGKEQYLTWSKWAACYFTSWMYHYNAEYSGDAEFTVYGYRTLGATAVSVQHPALDEWGEYLVPEFLKLWRLTGEEKWRKRAGLLWQGAVQLIAAEDSEPIHGYKRPTGSQNEAFFHCRWGHRKDCNERGHLNDWLVAWVNLFRLSALERIWRMWGEDGIGWLYETMSATWPLRSGAV